jgi:hypothetical protein
MTKLTNGRFLNDRALKDRGMNLSFKMPPREKLFFGIISETQLQPF